MAKRGLAFTPSFKAWDTGTNSPKTGDAANMTVEVMVDTANGVVVAGAVTEILNHLGVGTGRYRVPLSASEMNGNAIRVYPKSLTSGVQCEDVLIVTETQWGVNSVTITAQTAGAVPIAGVFLRVTNSARTADLMILITDANGQAALNLDPGTYYVRALKSMYSFSASEYTLTVTGDGATLTVIGTPVSVSLPAVARQTVYDNCILPDGVTPGVGAVVTAIPSGANQFSTTTLITVSTVSVVANASGYFELPLVQGVKYDILAQLGALVFFDIRNVLIDTNVTKLLSGYVV